jgi:hypothetical protein
MLYVVKKISSVKEINLYRLMTFVILNSVIFYIRYITTTSFLGILLSAVTFAIILKFIIQLEFKRSYVLTTIIFIMIVLMEIIFGVVFILIATNFDFNNPNIIILSIVNLLTVMALYISVNIKPILHFYQKIYQNVINMTISVWAYTILFLAIMIYSASRIIMSLEFNTTTIIYILITCIMLSIFISLIIEKLRRLVLQNNLNTFAKYAENYEKMFNKKLKFHHETKNQLVTIKGLIKNNKELTEYVDSILDDYKLESYAEFDNLFTNLPCSPIRSLLIYKLAEIKNKNIKYVLSINKKYRNLNIKINDQKEFCKILGAIIDNAIEEAARYKRVEGKVVTIDFSNNSKELKVVIANPIEKQLRLKKKIDRGFGLLLAYDIANRNKKINIKTEIVNGNYIQNVIYKKK